MKNKRQKFIYDALYKNVRQEQIENINLNRQELQSEKLGSLYHLNATGFIYHNNFWLWMLDYTAGVEISELANCFCDVVDEFVAWHDASVPFWQMLNDEKPERKLDINDSPVDFDNQTWYQDTLQFISVAILLRDNISIKRIINSLHSHRNRDNLYEQLIENYVDDPLSFKDLDHEKPYRYLNDAYYEIDAQKTIELIQKYLKNWYRNQNGARWYNKHHFINNDYAPYYGYWAFEAGATCFLLEIDDSEITNFYYPKDLVEYGRQLRKEGKFTSQVNDNII